MMLSLCSAISKSAISYRTMFQSSKCAASLLIYQWLPWFPRTVNLQV